MKLSIVIPAYNEKKTVKKLLRRVMAVKIPQVNQEIIIVDDGSTDGTREILRSIQKRYPQLKVIYH